MSERDTYRRLADANIENSELRERVAKLERWANGLAFACILLLAALAGFVCQLLRGRI